MKTDDATVAALKSRPVLLGIGVAVLVVILWLVVFFVPQGHKLSAINNQTQQARNEQAQLNARLAELRKYSSESSVLQALNGRLQAALPSTEDIYDYITALSNAAKTTGVVVQSVTPSVPQAAGNIAVIPVSVQTKGTYDQAVAFIKALYALPRLTVITEVSLSGGGTDSTRSTPLDETFSLEIMAQRSVLTATPS
jgi:Tfp pilus assembly protein PilO